MAWLTINGYDVGVSVGSGSMSQQFVGPGVVRSFSGRNTRHYREINRRWEGFLTPPISQAEARALRGLLSGEGHHWDFEDATYYTYSSKGFPKNVGSGTRASSTPAPKFGSYYLELAGSAQMTWALGYTGSWTIMFWEHDGSSWDHYIIDSDGNKYKNGATHAGAVNASVNGSGAVVLGDGSSIGLQHFDDLVVLPFLITSDMAATFGTATEAFSALPELTAAGDFCEDSSVTVLGDKVTLSPTPAHLGSGIDHKAVRMQFDLLEV